MKRIIPALAFLGMIFTFTACGDDSSSSKSDKLISCDQRAEWIEAGATFTLHHCVEASYTSENKEIVDRGCKSYELEGGFMTATAGTGCTGDEKKVCESKKNDALLYFYDEEEAKKSCEDLLAEYTEGDEVADGLISCDQKFEMTVDGETLTFRRCTDALNTSYNKQLVDETCVSFEFPGGSVTVVVGTGCLGEEKKTCKFEETDVLLHVYDEVDAKKSCEDLLAEYDNSEEEDDSSDGES